MKWIDVVVKIVIAIFGVIFLHVAFAYWLPYPYNHVHMILLTTVLIIFLYEHGSIIWFSVFWYLTLEYLSATPFGMILLSGVFTTALMYVAYKQILTNRSLVSAGILFTTGYVSYRVVYIVLYTLWAMYAPDVQVIFLPALHSFMLEWSISCVVLIVSFLLLRQVSRELNRQHIEESWFKHLGS